jgi:hypothetical protein
VAWYEFLEWLVFPGSLVCSVDDPAFIMGFKA